MERRCEPSRLLKDEGVAGLTAPAILEAVGRGAHKPSEIAARLATPQTSLSRLLQVLLDARLLTRELPWGESVRTTKRTLYRIGDPALRFWFQVYSPHRSRWRTYRPGDKAKLLDDHASTIFEDRIRARWPDAARYWEGDLELDAVRVEGDELVVSEVKWAALERRERTELEEKLEERFRRSALSTRYRKVRFEVLDRRELPALAR